jgi:hypothetical protein
MCFVKDEVVAQVQATIEAGVDEGISCKKVAQLCDLPEDNNFGALVVGYLIKSGQVVGFETRKGSGIVREGTPTAKSAKGKSKKELEAELAKLTAALATKAA